MKVALTKGTLWVPPTYFAVQHALAMDDIDWRVFTRVADIRDPAVDLPIVEATPLIGRASRSVRERLKWVCGRRMTRQITAWEPDVIHHHQATWSLPSIEASRRLGVPLIVTVHGGDAYRAQRPRGLANASGHLWNGLNRRASWEGATRLLAVSRFIADVALASGADSHRLHVHYQGVDTDFWTPPPMRSAPEVPTLLFVGALSTLKGVTDVIAASGSIVGAHPHRLVIVGDGPKRDEVARAAASHPHITATGPLDRAGVRDRMRSASALVMATKPYEGREEAAGLVLLEAQACGVPVVANAVGGTPEMLVDSVTGLLARHDDPASLPRALARILSMSESERSDMGAAGRTWVAHNRCLSAAADELRAHYTDVLSAQSRVRR